MADENASMVCPEGKEVCFLLNGLNKSLSSSALKGRARPLINFIVVTTPAEIREPSKMVKHALEKYCLL